MKTKFSQPVFLLLVLFTIILPNHHFVTRIKASLTLTEMEVTRFENKHLALCGSGETHDTPEVSYDREHTRPNFEEDHELNPTLNVLYLAHSPPALA